MQRLFKHFLQLLQRIASPQTHIFLHYFPLTHIFLHYSPIFRLLQFIPLSDGHFKNPPARKPTSSCIILLYFDYCNLFPFPAATSKISQLANPHLLALISAISIIAIKDPFRQSHFIFPNIITTKKLRSRADPKERSNCFLFAISISPYFASVRKYSFVKC